MNKTQKLILAIFVPIIFFFIALVIANSLGVSSYSHTESYSKGKYDKYLVGPVTNITSTRYRPNPFDWEKTWYVWLLYSASCCLFEFLLFRDNKIIAKKKK